MNRYVEYELFKKFNNANERRQRHLNSFSEIQTENLSDSVKESFDRYYEEGMTVEQLNYKILREDTISQVIKEKVERW